MVDAWRAQLYPILIVTRREVRDQFRDWRILLPVVFLTAFFPALMNFIASQAMSFVERYGASIVGDRLIPFLLMVVGFFPISISLVIALESFVGEKERRSIEPLLCTPLKDHQLYLGKMLAALVLPLFASYLGIGIYLVGVSLQVGWRPDPGLLAQILVLTAVQALVMVSGAVVVSSQTTSVRAANLLASFIVIPMALVIQGEAILMFWADYGVLWWVILGEVLIACLLIRSGIVHFNREDLLNREYDNLRLAWGWKVFMSGFTGQATSLGQWYGQEMRQTIRSLLVPSLLLALALSLAVGVGAGQARAFRLPPEILNWKDLDQSAVRGLEALRFFSVSGVGMIWLHNLRAIALATLLGIFSFGVLGIIVLMLPLALIGYLMANLAWAGLSPATFLLAFVLPHGILEIPAILLAGAAILRLGASLATPAQGQSVGEVWLLALADWLKVMVGLVMPLLLGAAFLEVFVTPRLAMWVLGG